MLKGILAPVLCSSRIRSGKNFLPICPLDMFTNVAILGGVGLLEGQNNLKS
jgi:hypothetical protein